MQKGVKGGPATGAHAAGAGSGCLLGGGEGVGGERVPGGALPGGVVGKVEVEIEVKVCFLLSYISRCTCSCTVGCFSKMFFRTIFRWVPQRCQEFEFFVYFYSRLFCRLSPLLVRPYGRFFLFVPPPRPNRPNLGNRRPVLLCQLHQIIKLRLP